jgi:hypothetical protein
MMAPDRSSLTRRATFTLFVLVGMANAGFAATVEDSAKELARKVAATVLLQQVPGPPQRNDLSVKVQNLSSLGPQDFDEARQALFSEFQKSGMVVEETNGRPPEALITLSENLESLVWTAEVHAGDTPHVVITTAAQPMKDHVVTAAMQMTLQAEKFWEGPERIFDVNFDSLSNFERRMVLLVRDGLIVTAPEIGAAKKRVAFPYSKPLERDPEADLRQIGNKAESWLSGYACEVDLDAASLVQCYVPPGPADVLQTKIEGLGKPTYGDQVKALNSNCGISNAVLAAGTGDYSEVDSIQIFNGGSPVSNAQRFPGPVLKLSQGQDAQFVTAIVRNLSDGNYELYRLSISCGQ